jgi:putative cell wall-binding protein/predicted transcriptional regulator
MLGTGRVFLIAGALLGGLFPTPTFAATLTLVPGAGLTKAPDALSVAFRAGADASHAAVDVTWDAIAIADSGGSGSAELITLDGVSVGCLTPATGSATPSGGTGPGGNGTTKWTMACGPITEGTYTDLRPTAANTARVLIFGDTAKDTTDTYFNSMEQVNVATDGRTTGGMELIGGTFATSITGPSGHVVDRAVFTFSATIATLNSPGSLGVVPINGGDEATIGDSSGPFPGDEPVVSGSTVRLYFPAGTLTHGVQAYAEVEAVTSVAELLSLPGQIGVGSAPPPPPPPSGGGVVRYFGADRYATSAAISKHVFAPGVPVAFVASGTNFPDALSGGPAATKLGGPILLVTPTSIPLVIITELDRLNPGRIVVLGGAGAVSPEVAVALRKFTAGSVLRYYGADRYATSAAISQHVFAAGVPILFVANGTSFPEPLAGGAAAAKLGGPVLLVHATSIPSTIASELDRLNPGRIVVLGGTALVSLAVQTQLKAYTSGAVVRITGADRYATSAAISSKSFVPGVPAAFVATGLNFPDALSGGPAAGKLKGPLLLVTTDSIPSSVATELARLDPKKIVVLGGPASVSVGVEDALEKYLAP